jgi:dUTP pyrophosphatase
MCIEVRFKLWPGGIAPKKCSPNAACFDLALPEDVYILGHTTMSVDLKIGFEPKDNFHFILMYPRSSLLVRHGIIMPVSVIDADYRGPVHAIMYNTDAAVVRLKAGTRVAQINLCKEVHTKFELVDELHETIRGENGIGSTGV